MASTAQGDDVASNVRFTDQHVEQKKAAPTPAAAGPSFAPPSKLEPFILLGKSARGAGAAKLIEEATAANGCYVFAELTQAAGISELLSSGRHPSHAALLHLFSHGSWKDYVDNAQNLPPLNPAQQAKLKQLSLVTAAGASRRLRYDVLRAQLDIRSDRELEDLIIDCIYADLLTGRLDQLNRRFDVERVVCARDVAKPQLGDLLHILSSWRNRVGNVIGNLDQLIDQSRRTTAQQAQRRAEQAKYVQRGVDEVTASTSGGGGGKGKASAAQHISNTVSAAFGGKGGQDDVMEVDTADTGASTSHGSPRKAKAAGGAGRKRARN